MITPKVNQAKNRPPASSAARIIKELPVRDPGGRTHRSFVLYGRSGTGKTTIAGTFPKKVLVCDIKDVGDDSLTGVKGLKVIDIRSWEDFEMVYWYLIQHPDEYLTVVFDTMTQLQQLAIRKVLEDKSKNAERAGDWGVMTKREWGDVAAMMKTWIINLRDLPMQVVFIAQDRNFNAGGEEDETQGLDPEVGPALSPSIAKALNAAVHFIANTFIRRRLVKVRLKIPIKGRPPTKEVEKIEFCARIGPNPIYITKVRKAREIMLPSVVVNPTYDKLMAIINGESNDKTDE